MVRRAITYFDGVPAVLSTDLVGPAPVIMRRSIRRKAAGGAASRFARVNRARRHVVPAWRVRLHAEARLERHRAAVRFAMAEAAACEPPARRLH